MDHGASTTRNITNGRVNNTTVPHNNHEIDPNLNFEEAAKEAMVTPNPHPHHPTLTALENNLTINPGLVAIIEGREIRITGVISPSRSRENGNSR